MIDLKAKRKPAPLYPCQGERMLAGEAAARGLDPVKVWHHCTTGEHEGHSPNCHLHPKTSKGSRNAD